MKRWTLILATIFTVLGLIACGDDGDNGFSNHSSNANESVASTVSAVRGLIKAGGAETTRLNHRVSGLVIGLGGQKTRTFYLYEGTYALQVSPTEEMDPPVEVGQRVKLTVIAGQVLESAIQVLGVEDWVVESSGNPVDYSGNPEISIENQGKMITRLLTIGTAPLQNHRSNDWREEIEGTVFRNNTGDHSWTAQGVELEAGKTYTIRGVVDAYGDQKAVAIFSADEL